MNFVNHPFSGATFFADVRSRMGAERGLFAGNDGPLRYVVMDAIFHRFEVYKRAADETFAVGAEGIEVLFPSVRVITNAQHCSSYSHFTPGPPSWQGEIITDHTVQQGTPSSYPGHRYFAQWGGVGEGSFWVQRGNPSEVSSPTTLRNAIGRLLPLINNGVRYGRETILDSNGRIVQKASAAIANWAHEFDATGKSIVGLHRASQSVFVLVQVHSVPGIGSGISIFDLIDRLHEMGVDDAVMGDGSTSVALVADGVSNVSPLIPSKDNSITTGFAFRRQRFTVEPGARLVRNNVETTHPSFLPGFVSIGLLAVVKQELGGIRLEIISFGSTGSRHSDDIANDLGITPPLILNSTSSRFDVRVRFGGQNQMAELALVDSTPSAPGRIVGALKIYTSQGDAVFDIDSPVGAYDDD